MKAKKVYVEFFKVNNMDFVKIDGKVYVENEQMLKNIDVIIKTLEGIKR